MSEKSATRSRTLRGIKLLLLVLVIAPLIFFTLHHPAGHGVSLSPSHPVKNAIASAFGFVWIAALFWIVESLWPEDALQPFWRGSSSRVDSFYLLFNNLVTTRITTVIIALAAIALTALHFPRLPPTAFARQPVGLQLLEAIVAGDFVGYWNHRLFHKIPALWRLHAVHHSTEQVDWLAAARLHPIESVVSKTMTTIPLYLLGVSGSVFAPYALFLAIYPLFLHANVPWNYGRLFGLVVASPAWHRWHHAADAEAINKNFANALPVWDYLFGTAHFPHGRHPEAYGLGTESGTAPMPATVWGQWRYPFKQTGR